MIIEKMKIINFKKFYGEKDIIFNEDFNVLTKQGKVQYY